MDDVELLKRFTASRDEAAFRTLAERHAGMVHAVCRRGLGGDAALADDATQAVFLILAQKAHTIRDASCLPGWLFRTAHAVVVNLKLSETRRKRREARAAAEREREMAMATPNEKWERARPYLNQAIASLRPKQQAAVVLRFLEGRSQTEAARMLGCSEGAVKERVAYALEKLRGFLARRGVSLSTVTLVALLTGEVAPLAPATLVASCASSVLGGTALGAGASAHVSGIAKGTMQMIFWAKVKTAAAVIVAVTLATAGTAAAVGRHRESPVAPVEPRAEAAAAAPAAAGRTWHVAPRELPGLPGDVQVHTLSEAAKRVQPGDTVIIHDGTYRETVVVETDGTAEKPIRFRAALGENVIITGADEITKWRKEDDEGNVYSAPWPHRFIGWSKAGTHPGDEYHKMIGRCEQVSILNYPLLQVLERRKLTHGTFHVDLEAKRLLVCPRDDVDLTKKNPPLVEASSRGLLWHSKGRHIHLRGVRFRYAANMAQHGAALFEGDNGVIEDCIFERMNSSGATLKAADLIFRRCTFQENGQLGFGANRAHNLLFSECLVRDNNIKGWNRGWEAGGDKLCYCRGAVLEKSRFVNNRGHGVWFDIGNEQCVVRNCLIADNEDGGIFYEISYGLQAHDNVIVGNGFNETPGSWGAASGISLSSSPNCIIERNLLVGNREGFNFREQNRKTPLIEDKNERWIWNHDQIIRNNVLAYNRDAQAWGWFDIDDGRHWPAAMQEEGEKKGGAAEDVAAKYKAKDTAGAPTGLSLEKLKLTFQNNLYAAQPWQGLFHWGVTWKRHKKYAKLDDVQSELGLEKGSRAAEFTFEDYLTRDFRVPADSPALKMGCYPKGEVPGVRLGVGGQ